LNYSTRRGIRQSFGGLVRRSAYLTDSETAGQLLDRHYDELKNCYNLFWPELKTMVQKRANP